MKDLTWQQWTIITESAIILLLLLAALFRNRSELKNFIQWLRPSAEGENKTASGRRLTAFLISAVCYVGGTYAFWHYAFTRPEEHLVNPMIFIWKFLADIAFIGLLWGFINQQTIVALKNGGGLNFLNGKKNGDTKTPDSTDLETRTDDNPNN